MAYSIQQPVQIVAKSSFSHMIAPVIPYLTVLVGMYGLHNAWIAVLGYHLGMLLLLTLDKQWPRAIVLLKGYSGRQVALAVLGGIGAGVVFYLCWPLLAPAASISEKLTYYGLNSSSWPYFLVYFIIMNPWLEELAWREYLTSQTIRLVWSDLFFAGFHVLVMAAFVGWLWLIISLVALTAAAWAWRQIARINNGLLVPLVSHAFADAGIVFTAYIFCNR